MALTRFMEFEKARRPAATATAADADNTSSNNPSLGQGVQEVSEPDSLPALLVPVSPHLDLADWIAGNHAALDALLRRRGAVLFRGFGLRAPGEVERCIRSWAFEC